MVDLTGRVFSRLTVLARSEKPTVNGAVRWICQCACGKQTEPLGYRLTQGHTRSCGCLQREVVAAAQTSHGMHGSKTYRAWEGMIGRCGNPSNKKWKNYGGRGIKVCERWMKFENFLADMGECPVGLSIERKNNSLGYSKENCKWATRIEQANNTRANVFVTHGGKTQTIQAWSREVGIHRNTISSRLALGWPVNDALSKSTQKRTKHDSN